MKQSKLQIWANEHEPRDEMIWKKAYWNQIIFVRDQIAGLLSSSYEEYNDLVDVVGSHHSKSIECPVYYLYLKDFGVHIWMRYNFHDWNISIESNKPIECDFLDTFDDCCYRYCFCQGMENKKFGPYESNHARFTVCIHNHYDLYTFFRCLKSFLGIKYASQ